MYNSTSYLFEQRYVLDIRYTISLNLFNTYALQNAWYIRPNNDLGLKMHV